MKNILFIGPYKDSNGLGYASRRYINCLAAKSDINLSIKPIFFTNSHIQHPLDLKTFESYENAYYTYYDFVIQYGYPEYYVYDKRFGKNIGIVEIETRSINRSGWSSKLNMMDEILVNSTNALHSAYDAGVTKPIRLLPEPYNIGAYEQSYNPFFVDKKETNPFIFYTIGQYTDKKNIKGIILAYLLEFNRQDNVRLFIKTDDYDKKPEELRESIKYDINEIKVALRKSQYCDIDYVVGRLSDQDIIRLHKDGDCYVNACKADGMGPCAIEAMLANKLIITTKNIGSSTYFNSSNALMVDSINSSVYMSNSILNKNIFTIYEEWNEPNIISLQSQMRSAYNMSKNNKDQLINNYQKQIFDMNNIKDHILI